MDVWHDLADIESRARIAETSAEAFAPADELPLF